jgi:hypothetical protein
MKPFSSSILSVNESAVQQHSNSSNTLKSIRENTIYTLLEFNEDVAKADLECTKDYYINLIKLANNPNTSDDIHRPIFHQYEAVRTAAVSLLHYVDGCENPDNGANTKLTKLYRISSKLKDVCKNAGVSVDLYTQDSCVLPNAILSESLSAILNNQCNRIIQAIASGEDLEDVEYTDSEEVLNSIAKLTGISDEVYDIEDFEEAYEDLFEFNTRTINFALIPDSADDSDIGLCMHRLNRPIGTYGIIIDNHILDTAIANLKANADRYNPNTVRGLVQNICNIICTIISLTVTIKDICNQKQVEFITHNLNAMKIALGEEIGGDECTDLLMTEAVSMFNNELDAKSLFDSINDDQFAPDDFTELYNNAIQEYETNKIKAYKEGLVLEAKLIASKNYAGLVSVQEGVWYKIKEAVRKFVDWIKKTFSKFSEAFLFHLGTEKAWLEKYRNTILAGGLSDKDEITFAIDYKNAFANLITNEQKLQVPPISYQDLMSGEKFNLKSENESEFFKGAFPAIAAFADKTDGETVAEITKTYYGAQYEKGKSADDNKMLWSAIKPNLGTLYKWMLDTQKSSDNIHKQIQDIERTVNNYNNSVEAAQKKIDKEKADAAANNAGTGGTPTGQPAEGEKPAKEQSEKAESFLSQFTGYTSMLEMEVNKAEDTNSQSGNSGGTTTNNDNSNNNLRMNKSDTDASVNAAKEGGDLPEVVSKRMEIYMRVTTGVLSAKMTALNSVHKEIMGLFRAIVKAKFGESADIVYKKQEGETTTSTSTAPDNKSTETSEERKDGTQVEHPGDTLMAKSRGSRPDPTAGSTTGKK